MANAKNLNPHRALDLGVQVCAEAMRDGWRVCDIDKTRGGAGKNPHLLVQAVRKIGDGYGLAMRLVPLTGGGLTADFSGAYQWVLQCGGTQCARCKDKNDCAAQWGLWGGPV